MRPVQVGEGEVDPFVHMKRLARRWARANGKHRKIRVTLTDVDPRTGEVITRRTSRMHGPLVRGANGFVSVNDGVAFADDLLRALRLAGGEAPACGIPLEEPGAGGAPAEGVPTTAARFAAGARAAEASALAFLDARRQAHDSWRAVIESRSAA